MPTNPFFFLVSTLNTKIFFRFYKKRNHTDFADYTCVRITGNDYMKRITPLKSMDYSNEAIIQLQNRYINFSREIKTSFHKTGNAQTKQKDTESFGSRYTIN